MPDSPSFIEARLARIRSSGLLRAPPIVSTLDGVHGTVDGRPALLFCSNDYLGLRTQPELRSAATRAVERYGAGTGSSRLIAGSFPIHEELERAVARWLGTETALVFSSGYQANLALLQALAVEGDLLLSDTLNHASLIDGARLARANVVILPHGAPLAAAPHLEGAAKAGMGHRFLVGEGLYSMDGERGPVAAWADLVEIMDDASLLVDEAHALGVLGPRGAGACAEAGRADVPLARVGTFGKALGSHGAFIACSAALRELLVNRSRSYIFSTGLPPAAAGAAIAAIRLARSDRGEELRTTLRARSRQLRSGLIEQGFALAGDSAESGAAVPIVPALIGAPEPTMALSRELLRRGIFASGIRPPTVPAGSCRIRFTLSATHREADVDSALSALAGAARELGLPR